MKILHVIPFLGCGGAEILTGSMARSMVKMGHDVRIVFLRPQHPSWKNYPDRENFLNEVAVDFTGGNIDFRFFRKTTYDNKAYVDYVKAFKPDIIHSHLYLAELVSRSFPYPDAVYISHGHDNMPQLEKFNWRWIFSKSKLTNYWERNWLIKQYKKTNTSFIAISKDVEDYLINNISEYRPEVLNLPNAINIERFAHERIYRSDLDQGIKLVSIANLVPKKNHIILLDVVKILLDHGIQVKLEVFGDGPLRPYLQEQVQAQGLENHVFFMGSVGGIPEKLAEADLYIHPALYEPFGLVLLEAMASGLPVVSMDGFGNRELIIDGENGFMLENKAPASHFAEKILWMIEHPEEYMQMGKKAQYFSRQFDMDHYAERLLSFYQKKIDHLQVNVSRK